LGVHVSPGPGSVKSPYPRRKA